MNNPDTTDHVLWPFDDEVFQEYDPYDNADMMASEHKLEKEREKE